MAEQLIDIDELVKGVTANFRTFGGGKTSDSNPVTIALKDTPPQFAAGVDVREVVMFIALEVVEQIMVANGYKS